MNDLEGEKSQATTAILDAIEALEASGRELDIWERVHLAEAVASCFAGLYRLALVTSDLALTPPPERSQKYPFRFRPDEVLFDLSGIRRALEEVTNSPARPFPVFR